MKLNHLTIFFLLLILFSYSCKKEKNLTVENQNSIGNLNKGPDIYFSSISDSLIFLNFLKSYSKANQIVLMNQTFTADKNGNFHIPYSSDLYPSTNNKKEFLGLKPFNQNTVVDPYFLMAPRPDLIPVDPPLSQQSLPPGGGGGFSAYVLSHGNYMGQTNIGTFYYPSLAFYTYIDPKTQELATAWLQTGSGIGGFQYENLWTQNSNGYTSSFGYATWSMTGTMGIGINGVSFGGFSVSQSYTYAIFIQINSNGTRTIKIEQR